MRNTALAVLLLALITAALAWWPATEVTHQEDVHKRMVSASTTASALSRIRIVSWDARLLQPSLMDIEKQGQDWVLPQHYQYPADAGSRVGELAGTLFQLELGRSIGNDMGLWNEFHLHDPMTTEANSAHHYGRRVSMWTQDGQQVLDIIIGAKIAGTTGRRYMRFVNDSRSFAVDFDQDLPTRFSDWVDTTLVPITPDDIRYLQVHQYSFDEATRRLRKGRNVQFIRKNVQALWQSPNVSEGQVVDDTAVYKVIKAALDARLYGVKPFPREVTQLEPYGFFYNKGIGEGAGRDPLAGNEGALTIGMKNGLFYHIYLGEVAHLPGHNEHQSLNFRYVLLLCDYRIDQDESFNQDNMKERMQAGKSEAAALNRRFAKYIYIIDNERFQLLHPDIDSMFAAVAEENP